jgi:intracellular multiplication protein IcmL
VAFDPELKKIVTEQYVTSAVVTGTPVIIATAVIRGEYTWKLQVPVMVTYNHGSQQTTQNFIWTVVLQRMNNNNSNQLLGIAQLIESPVNG